MLKVEQLVTGYGKSEIVQGLTLEVGDREIVSLIGPNGAGKSTLMKALFGLLDVWKGTVELDGKKLSGRSPEEIVRSGIGYVPQVDNVFPSLTVFENLQMGGYVVRESLSDRTAEVFELFPVLKEKRRQKAGELSGGQRQMLAFGRALMTKPVLLLLDEPTAGLAPKVADEIMQTICDINENGVALLIVEQNARKSLEISDRGYVLATGRNRFEGTGKEILENEEIGTLYLGG
jgi:ABC-type branched-subunit amino acid transport system ATPase component